MTEQLNLVIEKASYAIYDGSINRTIFFCENLKIHQGTQLAIKGASGAGKTTFLKLISGIQIPTTGQILWNDVNLKQLTEKERDGWRGRHIGFVFQDFRLFPHLTVLENVLLPFTFEGRITAEHRQKANDILAFYNLKADVPAKFLSRGEMQRAALARVLIKKPQVILADEPTASLDRDNAELIIENLINTAHLLNATLITVSHDASVLARFSHQMVLDKGVIQQESF